MKRKASAVLRRPVICWGMPWKARITACAVSVALVLSGCGRNGGQAAKDLDPQVNATLDRLTQELHHAMVGRKINRDFDEFVAVNRVEVPPPPVGKKYAINDKWKVILVDK